MKTLSRALVAALLIPATLTTVSAQSAPADSTKKKDAPPPVNTALDFSGVIYGNFQYRGDAGASKGQNKFDLERAYLTFKKNLTERTSIRVTADVFQQTASANNGYYKGWTVRAKYAYLQYDYLKNADITASVRGGLVHNMVIDYEEGFWPRWISKTALDRNSYFASSDAGIATVIAPANKMAEAYVAVMNGGGYDNLETDRFKDYQFRLALTPLAQSTGLPSMVKSLAVVPWYYKGMLPSGFVQGGAGQVGPVSEGLTKDRYGVFVGMKHPFATVGFDYAQRKDESESGANTVASPRVVGDSSGRLMSGFVTLKPFQIFDAKSMIPVGLVARWDQVKSNTDTDPKVNTVIAGITFDISKRASISLDYQEVTPHDGAPVGSTNKTYFLHWVANF